MFNFIEDFTSFLFLYINQDNFILQTDSNIA